MESLKRIVKRIPVISSAARMFLNYSATKSFTNSRDYWQQRYLTGGNSGAGSYNNLAEFKAQVINTLVAENGISSVIEFGCGDGNQLALAEYPVYLGLDVSSEALQICRKRFHKDPTKTFASADQYDGQKFDLALSLDVIYHLVEDDIYLRYMQNLVNAANKYIVIYSSNYEDRQHNHVRHRKFTDWMEVNAEPFKLHKFIKNKHPYRGDNSSGSLANFYIYKLASSRPAS